MMIYRTIARGSSRIGFVTAGPPNAGSPDLAVVRVEQQTLTYPVLSSLFAELRGLMARGTRRILVDLACVAHVDSPALDCLLAIDRLLTRESGCLSPAGLQPRVATMLAMLGVPNLLRIYPTAAAAVRALTGPPTMSACGASGLSDAA